MLNRRVWISHPWPFCASLALILINCRAVFPGGKELRQDSCKAPVSRRMGPSEAPMAPPGRWGAVSYHPPLPAPPKKRGTNINHHHPFPSGGFQGSGCRVGLALIFPMESINQEDEWAPRQLGHPHHDPISLQEPIPNQGSLQMLSLPAGPSLDVPWWLMGPPSIPRECRRSGVIPSFCAAFVTRGCFPLSVPREWDTCMPRASSTRTSSPRTSSTTTARW